MTNQEYIFNRLRRAGFTAAGAAGIVGNLEAESNCEPCRVQGDFSPGFTSSKTYTSSVDSGAISHDQFIYHGPGGGGYGLAQWTYPARKAGLYDMAQTCRDSIGSIDLQIDWLLQELMTGEYSKVNNVCRSATSVNEASDVVLYSYERPADPDGQRSLRRNLAQKFYDLYAENSVQDETAVETPAQQMDAQESFWPPRVLCEGMEGADVLLAKAMLLCHGYDVRDLSQTFDADFTQMVKAYQEDHWLDVDGIVGPKTMRAGGITY